MKKTLAADDPRHGTYNAYNNCGCRCDPCKEAARKTLKGSRQRRLKQPIPDHVHGTVNGYVSYACHCSACRSAKAKQERERQQRFRAQTGDVT